MRPGSLGGSGKREINKIILEKLMFFSLADGQANKYTQEKASDKAFKFYCICVDILIL